MASKYDNDTTSHLILGNETLIYVTGEDKKGRIFGFDYVFDPQNSLEGTSSTITSREVIIVSYLFSFKLTTYVLNFFN